MFLICVLSGLQATYFLGGMLVTGACTWNWFVRKDPYWEIFASSVLLGAGCSTILVTSLSMTADLIGDQTVSNCKMKTLKMVNMSKLLQ